MISVPIDFLRDNVNRYRKLIKGERVSHAPFRLWLDNTFVCAYTGIDPHAYGANLETMFEAQRITNERFYDLRDFSVDIGTIDLFFDDRRYQDENPGLNPYRFLESNLDNFDRYYSRTKVSDLPSVGRLLEGIDYFNKRLPPHKQVCHYFGITGAMDLFSIFRGTENFFVDLYDNPKKVKQIFNYITERSLEWLEFAEKTWGGGAPKNNILFDKLDIGEDYCAYLRPDMFDEFIVPHTGAIFAKYKGKYLCSLHTDGDMPVDGIGKLAKLGIDELMGFSPNIDVKEFRKSLPNVILGGNIHPIKVMIEGSPADVKSAVQYSFENANQNQRYVLCTGGSISAGATAENVDAFLEAAYEVVKYE